MRKKRRKRPVIHRVGGYTKLDGTIVSPHIKGSRKVTRVPYTRKVRPKWWADTDLRVGEFFEKAWSLDIVDPDFYHWADGTYSSSTLDKLAKEYQVTKEQVMKELMEPQ